MDCLDIPGSFEAIHYIKCNSLPDLMVFFHSLTSFLDQYPKVKICLSYTYSLISSKPLRYNN